MCQQCHHSAVDPITVSSVQKSDSAARWEGSSATAEEEMKSYMTIPSSLILYLNTTGTLWKILPKTTRCFLKSFESVLTAPRNPERQSWNASRRPLRNCIVVRRGLKLDPNASRVEQPTSSASCRRSLHEDLQKLRQNKIMKAAKRKRSPKKCRKNLREYNVSITALRNEDGISTFSHREMESVTEGFYTNLFCFSTAVPSPNIPAGEKLPRILPSKARVAIRNMRPGTASGPDLTPTDLLRAGGDRLHGILAAHSSSYLEKERIPDQWRTSPTILLHKKVTKRIFETTVQYDRRARFTSVSQKSSSHAYRRL
ncbi:hypothetical protein Y032_0283g1296 [Ancylostoma ceylanicum]|uniref:Uncharacterized protein n=1 Tax=Ancylostoma ceylanicum TaxID=53326 RepID=A0A016S7E2_9BILA|nr:hypothetical protein Y032_0283g1296 [Ancylostoma ceylanicum]